MPIFVKSVQLLKVIFDHHKYHISHIFGHTYKRVVAQTIMRYNSYKNQLVGVK